VDDLRQRLIDVWKGMEQGVVDDAIDDRVAQLSPCIVFRPKEDTLNIHSDLLISLICSVKICR